jgi:hypothetical protein
MSWGVDSYLELKQQGLIGSNEHGAMPLPEEVATAMEQCADGIERHAAAITGNPAPMAPEELRRLAADIRDGTPTGREAFRATLLDIAEIKRGNRLPGGVTRYLPVDVLAPFGTTPEIGETGEHVRRILDEIAETKELTDPALRR